MGLSDLWRHSKSDFESKHIQQIMAFAGNGTSGLRDGVAASTDFRGFLAQVPSAILKRYADECLKDNFQDRGLALQDVVNQIGRRLGFEVTDGRYRGITGKIGFDGLWSADGHTIVAEVKTTDAYRIDLEVVVGYRRALERAEQIAEENASILIIVGRQDTGDLEAQVRGSRHARDVRLISVDALLRLLRFKEELDDPGTVQKIRQILVPREFTRLDGIIDLVFSTTEDVRSVTSDAGDKALETVDAIGSPDGREARQPPRAAPANFNEQCAERVQSYLGRNLVRKTKTRYSTADGSAVLITIVSKEHVSRAGHASYWLGFHPSQQEIVREAHDGYIALGCGSDSNILLIPYTEFALWLDGMNTTRGEHGFYWHISVFRTDGRYMLHRRQEFPRLELTRFLLARSA